MKPFINILLSFLYVAATAGIPVEVHYCRGDIVSVGILPSGENCCCHETAGIRECCTYEMPGQTCSLESAGDCCSSEHYSIQYFQDKQVTKSTNTNFRPANDHGLKSIVQFSESEDTDSNVYCRFHDLPPLKPQPLWLLHCTLTFYG